MATVQRTLQRSELRILAILGVPTFALALAITTVSTYLPVLAEDFSEHTYPTATRVSAAAGAALGGAYNPDHAYAFGLARVLDGLDVLITRKAPSGPGEAVGKAAGEPGKAAGEPGDPRR